MPVTFVVPQTGKELIFSDLEIAYKVMEDNFDSRIDAVGYEHGTDANTNKVSFTYRDKEHKIIFYAKQK